MITRNLAVVALAVLVMLGCQGPEAFHSHLSSGQPVGAAGTGAPPGAAGNAGLAGTTGNGTGAAGIPPLPTGEAGTMGGGSFAGATGAAGTSAGAAGTTAGTAGGAAGTGGGAAGMAGTAGGAAGTGQAGTGGGMAGATGRAGTGGGAAGTGGGAAGTGGRADAGVADAVVERPPSQPYPTAAWRPTASITAQGNADVPQNAFDGMIGTRWSTGRNQQGDETFLVDLGSAMLVSRVVIDDTTHPNDFAAAYTVEISTNNTAFTNVKMGAGARVIDVQFPQAMARYVRIRQTGMTPAPAGSWWSIDELRIYP